MAKIELKNIKEKIQGAYDKTKEAVKDVYFNDVKEKIQETTHSTVKAFKNVKMPKENTKKVKSVLKKKETEKNQPTELKVISTRSAIKIIYYLMAADGEIFHSEEEKFDAIGNELDPNFANHKEGIITECKKQLDKVIDKEDYYEALQDGVEDAILQSRASDDTFITPKHLVWNLLATAYSDENYNEVERKLMKYIVRKTDIDKGEFLELESSILTLNDIEKEITWLKTTNRSYLTIEAMVNELEDRKSVIFESVKELILL